MARLYPPILENQGLAIPYRTDYTNINYTVDVTFDIPDMNSFVDINHYQISIKYKTVGGNAVSPIYSPDYMTIFLKKTTGDQFQTYSNGNRTVTLHIPYYCFNEGPKKCTSYNIQVRFGSAALWDPASIPTNFAGFADWRARETSKSPSGFGEWSNVQSVYCYGRYDADLTCNVKDFTPEFTFTYSSPEDTDPLMQCKFVYQYNYGDNSVFKSKTASIAYNDLNTWSSTLHLNIAPLIPIRISVEGVTKNNHVVGGVYSLNPISLGICPEGNDPETNPLIEDGVLQDEEINDGVIYKVFKTTKLLETTVDANPWMSVYRINIFSLETVKIINRIPISVLTDTYMKDFCVEMGEDYQYIACLCNDEGVSRFLTNYLPFGFENIGYGRLTRMDSVFLTTKYHQLRLEGNVQLTALKKNVSENFQTTIGSKYPFYSRNSEIGYRTFQLQSVITLNSDPTNSFFQYDENNGLMWKDDIESKLIILNRDLFGQNQFSRSRFRVRNLFSNKDNIIEYSQNKDFDTGLMVDDTDGELRGPSSIFDEYYGRDATTTIGVEHSDENVFMERKFREYVMDWLSDGKPKLFRSETEGNMIVMTTGVSFTPLDKTNRMVYSASMTITEIAEYNLENLIEYELIPTVFETRIAMGFPEIITLQSKVNLDVVRGISFYMPRAAAYFDFEDGKYMLNPVTPQEIISEINDVLNNITRYSFLRGDPQSPIYKGLVRVGEELEIETCETGTPYGPIRVRDLFRDIVGDLSYEVISPIDGNPYGLVIDTTNDIIYSMGLTVKKNTDPVLIRVSDDSHNYSDLKITMGYVYEPIDGYYMGDIPDKPDTSTPIHLTVRGTGGITFTEAGTRNDGDYYFTSKDLPSGLTLDPYKGEITGTFNYSTTSAVKFHVKIEDALGHYRKNAAGEENDIEITFNKIDTYPYIDTTKVKVWNIPMTEEGEMYDVDVTDCFIGGDGNFVVTTNATGGSGIVRGIAFTKDLATGHWHIAGAPTSAGDPGSVIVTITDNGGAVGGRSATAVLNYGTTVPKFRWLSDGEVGNLGDGYFEPDVKGKSTSNATEFVIPVNSHYSFDLLTGSITGRPLVEGGLPFSGTKPYEFRGGRFLSPDYRISKSGVISGTATTSYEKRENVEIYAKDARGKEIMRTFIIDKIVGSIKYKGPALSLPETYVGKYTTIDTGYTLEVKYSDFEGGFKNYHITAESLAAATAKLSPIGMKITETPGDGGGLKIEPVSTPGYPTAATPAGFKIELVIEDNTNPDGSGESSGALSIPVQINKIYENLRYKEGGTTKNITIGDIYETDYSLKEYIFPGAIGGKYPYSADLISGTLAPYELYGGEGTEQNPDFPYIFGITQKTTAAITWTFKLVDAFGQEITSVVTLPVIPERMKFYPKTNLNTVVLTRDVSVMPQSGATAVQIVQGIDGRLPYKYGILEHAGIKNNEVIPGLKLDPDTGILYGVPTRSAYGRDDYNEYFTLLGGSGYTITGLQYNSENPNWATPRVCSHPIPNASTANNYSTIDVGYAFCSVEPLFLDNIGLVGGDRHPDLRFEVESATGHTLEEFGLFFDTTNCLVYTPTPEVVKEPTNPLPASFQIHAIIPGNDWTPDQDYMAEISFGSASSNLKYVAATYDLKECYSDDPPKICSLYDIGGDGLCMLRGYPSPSNPGDITFEMTDAGIFAPYASVSGDNLTLDFSTLTSKLGAGMITITAKNNINGQTAVCKIKISGVYMPLTFAPTPVNILIPSTGTDIAAGTTVDLAATGIYNSVVGGSGDYSYNLILTGPVGEDLEPFGDAIAAKKDSITLESNIENHAARTAQLQVTDNITHKTITSPATDYVQIALITGFPTVTVTPVPDGAAGKVENIPLYFSQFVGASTTATKVSLIDLPSTWDGAGEITFLDDSGNPISSPAMVSNQLSIRLTRPASYTPAGKLTINLEDARFPGMIVPVEIAIGATTSESKYVGLTKKIPAGRENSAFAPITFDLADAADFSLDPSIDRSAVKQVKITIIDDKGWNT